MLELSVPAPNAGERLDRFLAGAQADLSRSRLQGLIREGRVRVNGAPGRASLRLADGDRIEVALPEIRAATLEPEALPLEILFEDEHLLVINKPAGLVVHPGAGVRTGTLVHALLHHDPAIAAVGGEGRPGIVHRLDRDTSGLLVVARTEEAHRALQEAVRERRVERVYLALAEGRISARTGTIDAPIGRASRQRHRMAVSGAASREARTHFEVLELLAAESYLEAKLETGRTHQIRAHFAAIGHPLVGDTVYGGPARHGLERQFLHAHRLAFDHPVSGERLEFRSELPEDLAAALDAARSG
jgi:23S rRNA pseudouridine1911/1915/1917 synthase